MVFTFVVCLVLPMLSMCHDQEQISKSITFKNCGTENNIKSVDMVPCPELPCAFKKGTNVTVSIDFVSKDIVSSITSKVYGIVAGIPVPYALPKPNGCQDCNLTCPLLSGEHRYQNIFPVLPSYPDIRLPVKWELIDDQGKQLLCFEFPMSIVG